MVLDYSKVDWKNNSENDDNEEDSQNEQQEATALFWWGRGSGVVWTNIISRFCLARHWKERPRVAGCWDIRVTRSRLWLVGCLGRFEVIESEVWTGMGLMSLDGSLKGSLKGSLRPFRCERIWRGVHVDEVMAMQYGTNWPKMKT
jgi:hypothetical protein